jgi:hypothetical protein
MFASCAASSIAENVSDPRFGGLLAKPLFLH